MSAQRKTIPEFVQWDQQSILREIAALKAQISTLTNLTENPTSDTRATVVRNVRDYEILSALDHLSEIMERVQMQLSFITNIELFVGDG